MARDFNDFKNQYVTDIEKMDQRRESILREYQEKLREYQEKLQKYREATSSFFTRWLGDVLPMPIAPKEPDLSEFEQLPNREFAQVGQRFAIQYGDITGAVCGVRTSTDNTFPPAGYNMVSITRRTMIDETSTNTKQVLGDIADLWTVIEYLGDGYYRDLITGEVLTVPKRAEGIMDTVTQSTEKEALLQHARLLDYPLGIRTAEVTKENRSVDHQHFELNIVDVPITEEVFPVVQSLTPEIQEMIIEQSIPRKKEIQDRLAELKNVATDNLNDYFRRLDATVIDQYHDDAMSRIEQMHTEEEQIRQAVLKKLEEIKAEKLKAKRQEEKKQQEANELARQREIQEAFEKLFQESQTESVQKPYFQK